MKKADSKFFRKKESSQTKTIISELAALHTPASIDPHFLNYK